MSAGRRWLLALGLALGTALVFSGAFSAGFVTFDDPTYVTENPVVARGLTGEGLAWAFTETAGANWHPLTWLSHMLDVELFGLEPAGHHATSVLLHAATAALLLLFLTRATGRAGLALVAAALFAVHPLRVESVVWVAERKDVLSGLFFALALLLYERHAREPRRGTYAAVTLALALGLLAKPMLVTLPVVLLICDVWPLGRLRDAAWIPLATEKLGWLLMAGVVALVTLASQGEAGAVRSVESFPLAARLANAAVAAVTYLVQTVWPFGLSFHVPHPLLLAPGSEVPAALLAQGAGAALLLAAVTVLVLRQRRTRPWLAIGWAWYAVTLLPVIGLVQVGNQARADRYTYLTTIGPVVAAVWLLDELLQRSAAGRRAGVAAAGLFLAFLAARTVVQVRTWRNSETLYRHALAVEPRNVTALVNLGDVLLAKGDVEGATRELEAALALRPDHVLAGRNLGVARTRAGDLDGALEVLRRTLERAPEDVDTRAALGNVLARAGRLDEARAELERVVAADPERVGAWLDLAAVAVSAGDLPRAAERYERVLALDPGNRTARETLARVRERLGAGGSR